MTLESNKISVLLGALDFNPDVGQKTLIVTNSIQEVEDVYKVKWQHPMAQLCKDQIVLTLYFKVYFGSIFVDIRKSIDFNRQTVSLECQWQWQIVNFKGGYGKISKPKKLTASAAS